MVNTAWPAGYRAALVDLQTIAGSRGLLTPELQLCLDDLAQDSRVIEHALDNREARKRLLAAREAKPDLAVEPELPLAVQNA